MSPSMVWARRSPDAVNGQPRTRNAALVLESSPPRSQGISPKAARLARQVDLLLESILARLVLIIEAPRLRQASTISRAISTAPSDDAVGLRNPKTRFGLTAGGVEQAGNHVVAAGVGLPENTIPMGRLAYRCATAFDLGFTHDLDLVVDDARKLTFGFRIDAEAEAIDFLERV
jgi:hypothetical protein